MAKTAQIELLRELFKDQKLHIALAKITETELVSDRSRMRVKCEIWPDEIEIIAEMTWEQVGPDAGIFGFPVVDDLVIVGFHEGNQDFAFVLKRLTSKQDKIPIQAQDGSTVIRALAGKKTKLISDTKVSLQRASNEGDPGENVVLGQVFKTAYSEDLQLTADHRHICMPPGYLSVEPINRASFLAIKADPVDNEDMLSDLSFTEK